MPGEAGGRILFHAKNGGSLGHLNRVLALAEAVLEFSPSTEVLLLNENDPRFVGSGVRQVHIPSIERVRSGYRKEDTKQQVDARVIQGLIVGALAKILLSFQPNLVVYDTFIWRGMQLLARGLGAREVLVLRLRKDGNRHLAVHSHELREMQRILIPHHMDEWEHVRIPRMLRGKVTFTGPILRRSRSDADSFGIRGQYGIDTGAPIVLITGGGGGFPEHTAFYSMALAALKEAERELRLILGDFRTIVITGPHFRQDLNLWMDNGIIIREVEPRLFDLMASASLVVCEAGYNTINELIELRVPAVCVPAWRSYDDQTTRARWASRRFPWLRAAVCPSATSLAAEMVLALRKGAEEVQGGGEGAYGNRIQAARILVEVAGLPRSGGPEPGQICGIGDMLACVSGLTPRAFFERW